MGAWGAKVIEERVRVPGGLAGARLDVAAHSLLPQYSRARLQGWIRAGQLTLDGEMARQRDKVAGGEEIEVLAAEAQLAAQPEAIPLAVVHEDDWLLVLNKPAGRVAHPGAGNPGGTLMNALLYRDPAAAGLPRAGLVHRLDKGTSGLLLVAKRLETYLRLVEMLQEHAVQRHYEALVYGVPASRVGRVDKPIARHPVQRTVMAVREGGKPAVTHYEVRQAFTSAAYLRCELETGRTHQIRVHMKAIGHPIIGDVVYGGQLRAPKGGSAGSTALLQALRAFTRPALHARELRLDHPHTGEPLRFTAPPPDDFRQLRDALAAV